MFKFKPAVAPATEPVAVEEENGGKLPESTHEEDSDEGHLSAEAKAAIKAERDRYASSL